ncbi:hypothetical protein SSABA_v1c05470 [Spiroplasma sabaudiense Ar-1343]|uniref:HMA domain-containing protein n=1 Tax=Spiroplasma sabaudiense Ar-1343 TaxID=1276257 RepID=W6AAB3_9MOLU|nr:heavy metal-associated domain-containing protein [Spiroplasma sabaudiense]AHI53951.1 hypothetical protein SSABA_v1c05470 [Spiroplasma sabaudiense Ar-1343]
MNSKKVKITNMSCNHCVLKITKMLKAQKDIKNITLKLQPPILKFDYKNEVAAQSALNSIEELGYCIGDEIFEE